MRLAVLIVGVVIASLGRAVCALGLKGLSINVLLCLIHGHVVVIQHH